MTAKVERLLNLTVALLDTRRPLTLTEIRDRIAGYDQDEDEAARRMFERDKDDLRKLGVPIRTVALDAWETDWGYTVDKEEYALPAVQLDRDEIAALALVLRTSGEESARLGLTKLAARAPDPGRIPSLDAHVDVGSVDALDALADPLIERQAVRFDYRAASGEATTRTIDPYGVVQRRGAWYLVGRDHDRDALRAFRLERLASRPRAVGETRAFDVPDGLDLVAAVSGPTTEGVEILAAFAPAVAWEATRRGQLVRERPDGTVEVRFPDADPDRLLPWILGFGPDAEVLAPAEVRERAVTHLTALLETLR